MSGKFSTFTTNCSAECELRQHKRREKRAHEIAPRPLRKRLGARDSGHCARPLSGTAGRTGKELHSSGRARASPLQRPAEESTAGKTSLGRFAPPSFILAWTRGGRTGTPSNAAIDCSSRPFPGAISTPLIGATEAGAFSATPRGPISCVVINRYPKRTTV
jgi:hypothetical protein